MRQAGRWGAGQQQGSHGQDEAGHRSLRISFARSLSDFRDSPRDKAILDTILSLSLSLPLRLEGLDSARQRKRCPPIFRGTQNTGHHCWFVFTVESSFQGLLGHLIPFCWVQTTVWRGNTSCLSGCSRQNLWGLTNPRGWLPFGFPPTQERAPSNVCLEGSKKNPSGQNQMPWTGGTILTRSAPKGPEGAAIPSFDILDFRKKLVSCSLVARRLVERGKDYLVSTLPMFTVNGSPKVIIIYNQVGSLIGLTAMMHKSVTSICLSPLQKTKTTIQSVVLENTNGRLKLLYPPTHVAKSKSSLGFMCLLPCPPATVGP